MGATGRAFVYGDNVDTDVIIPARYLSSSEPEELAAHCMEDLDGSYASAVRPGDVIVAGANFGCGSSREHAPLAIKASGASCVVASSFARIFYRNAINIGLPIMELEGAGDFASPGDLIEVDFETGEIRNATTLRRGRATAFPPFMRAIMEAGGLVGYVRAKLAAGRD